VSSPAGDPYADPASGVLRNLLGITDTAELARAEAALSASRLIDLERRRLPGRDDLAHLQAFHRYILGDIYDGAGQLRTVSIAKGSVFCLPQHLESYAADVFGRLGAADRLQGLARDPFIPALAGFCGEDERPLLALAIPALAASLSGTSQGTQDLTTCLVPPPRDRHGRFTRRPRQHDVLGDASPCGTEVMTGEGGEN
jgi:hypothetical protein